MPDRQGTLTTVPDLAILVVAAAQAVSSRLVRELTAAGFPVRPAPGYVLRALHERPLTLTALAEVLGVTKQAAAPTVDEMAVIGLVEPRPDPADRRSRQLALTAAGSGARE